MTTEEIKELIADHAETLKGNDKASLEFIEQTMDYLMFLKRFIELSHEEKEDFASAMHGGQINQSERDKLLSITDSKKKDAYMNDIARANYFRRCAWLSYLHGEKNSPKPNVSLSKV